MNRYREGRVDQLRAARSCGAAASAARGKTERERKAQHEGLRRIQNIGSDLGERHRFDLGSGLQAAREASTGEANPIRSHVNRLNAS
jgi:hypothetical protein